MRVAKGNLTSFPVCHTAMWSRRNFLPNWCQGLKLQVNLSGVRKYKIFKIHRSDKAFLSNRHVSKHFKQKQEQEPKALNSGGPAWLSGKV